MKKLVMPLILLILSSTLALASIDSIYEYLQRIDKGYEIVLGEKAKGGDSLAAIDVAIGIEKYNYYQPRLEPVMENNVGSTKGKILIGHPCDNSLVPLKCDEWLYRPGESIIRVVGDDLLIAGSTVDDTRRAAKIIGNYKAFPQLKETLSVIIVGYDFKNLNVTKEKSREEMICGDGICEPGEGWCQTDCADTTCFGVCQAEGFGAAACRDQKSNPNVPSCFSGELDKGAGYCATGKVCCCEKVPQPQKEKNSLEFPFEEKTTLWQKIMLFLKSLFSSETS